MGGDGLRYGYGIWQVLIADYNGLALTRSRWTGWASLNGDATLQCTVPWRRRCAGR